MLREAGPAKTVLKRKGQLRAVAKKPVTKRDYGLWVDYELLRKHRGPLRETILYGPTTAVNNRYLELADLALKDGKSKNK